jgi:hypothetical protein
MFRALIVFLFLVVSSLKIVSAGVLPPVPHELNFVYTNTPVELEWSDSCGPGVTHELRGRWLENGSKEYDLPDYDGDLSNCAATVKIPRGGHWFVEVRATDGTFYTEWTSSTQHWDEEPIGWFIHSRPAPPAGGGISEGR